MLKHAEHRIVESETLDEGSDRADRNVPAETLQPLKKRKIQTHEDKRGDERVPDADAAPVERHEDDRKKFHGHGQGEGDRRRSCASGG